LSLLINPLSKLFSVLLGVELLLS